MKTEAQTLGRTLFNSAEYVSRGRTDNEDYVHDLYWAWVQRAPEEDGFARWLSALQTQTRAQVLDGFANSGEFERLVAALCAQERSASR